MNKTTLKAFVDELEKTALDVEYRDPDLLESTLGRLGALEGAVLIRPQKIEQVLGGAERGEYDSAVRKAIKAHGKSLEGTKIYIGGGGPFREKWERTLKNKKTSLLGKAVGIVSTPVNHLMTKLRRVDHYDPLSDTSTIYMGGSPAVLQHELGHAVDFNEKSNPLLRDAYALAPSVLGPLAAPVKVPMEFIASRNALRAVRGDVEAEADTYSTLAPAFGTYAGGAAGSLYALATGDKRAIPVGILGGVALGHAGAAVRNMIARAKAKSRRE